jgi:fatty acid desaturase
MSSAVKYPRHFRGLVPNEKLRALHSVSTFRGIFSIILEWFLILTAAWLCEKFFYWPVYLFAVIFIGARLLALGLIMHESVHYLISRNRLVNDFVAEIFCAWPLFISMRSYRVKHLAHHKWLNTELDPDYIAKTDANWKFPMSLNKFIKVLMIQISGFGIFETFKVMSSAQMKHKKAKTPLWYTITRIVFYLLIVGSFIASGKGMLLLKYWFIPFATWTQLANRLRRVAEHSGIEGRDLSLQTRTTKHGIISNFFLAPKNIAYHTEHHLYPGIPCYHLPEIHTELIKHDLVKEHFYYSDDYLDVIHDCTIH